MAIGRFVGGIAAVIYHPPTQTYLVLRRSARRDAGGGEWECVTGRVDQGESFEAAVKREVREELGVEITLDFIIGTSHFYRGAALPENELLAVRYACTVANRDSVIISDEHDAHHWMTVDEVYAFLPSDHWLIKTIQRTEVMRRLLPPELLTLYHAEGFNLGF
jgi:8-oxo-dGTP diphosphatase